MYIDGELRDARSGKQFDKSAPPPASCWAPPARRVPRTWWQPSPRRGARLTDRAGAPTTACANGVWCNCRRRWRSESEELREELVAEVGAPADDDDDGAGRLAHRPTHCGFPPSSSTHSRGRASWVSARPPAMAPSAAWSQGARWAWWRRSPRGTTRSRSCSNKLGQALATGNTVVLKPDPNTPWILDAAGPADRRAHRHPGRGGQRGPPPGQ